VIVFLILAHRDFDHLLRLIDSLDGQRIVLHIDKSSSDLWNKSEIFRAKKNLILINRNDSFNVRWAGYSQILAMLLMMKTAIELMESGERMMFLSGSDYPIKSKAEIESKFASQPSLEFLRYYKLDDRPKDVDRWASFHRWDFRFFKKRGTFLNRLNSLFIRFLTFFETMIRGRKEAPIFPLYAGSQWFAISKECAQELIRLRNHHFDNFFKTMFAPDEVYFHTLFSLSSYSNSNIDKGVFKTIQNGSRLHQVRNLTYVDESLNKWLDKDDLGTLLESEFLFARKFDSKISEELINAILSRF
jgi:hypothetical protein